MRVVDAREVRTHAKASPAFALCVGHRTDRTYTTSVHGLERASAMCGIASASLDAGDPDAQVVLSSLGITAVPEVLLWSDGVLIDRAPGFAGVENACEFLCTALRVRIPSSISGP